MTWVWFLFLMSFMILQWVYLNIFTGTGADNGGGVGLNRTAGVWPPYFVQGVHVIWAVPRGPRLGVSWGRRRARAGAHHAVRGARGGPRAGAQHGTGGGTRTRGGTWPRGAPHGRIRCWHGPGSPAPWWAGGTWEERNKMKTSGLFGCFFII